MYVHGKSGLCGIGETLHNMYMNEPTFKEPTVSWGIGVDSLKVLC